MNGIAAAETATPRVVRTLVGTLLVYAFLVRFLRCGEGLPYIHGWDEPQTAGTALRIMQTGDFNPHFFTYGSVTVYLHLLVDILHYFYLMGQPDTAPSYLKSLSEIRTQFDTGWIWTISHPSFYFWNRALVALMGTGAVGLVYLIGRRVAGWGAGLLAAALLAGLEIHIRHSTIVTPDVPTSVFVLATVLLSIVFVESGRAVHL
ncbi:MAG TPA: glycosyltransferase family 39 protein, partial [Verrucomicrobiae bacterium]|nr:glycosyltransferase family 39 protein [Verrucomicrobiae bacterium]